MLIHRMIYTYLCLLLALLLGSSCSIEDEGTLGNSFNLSASQGTHTDHVELQWDAISGATMYVLSKKEETSADFGDIYQGNETKYLDYNVEAGIQYQYRVKAWGSNDKKSDYSDAVIGYSKAAP